MVSCISRKVAEPIVKPKLITNVRPKKNRAVVLNEQ